jgi:hypothetical protein
MHRLWRWIYVRAPYKLRVKANEWKTWFSIFVLKQPRGRRSATEHDWLCEHHGRLIEGNLVARVIRKDGTREKYNLGYDEYKDEGPNTVTDAGVAAMVNDWYDASKDITSFNYHEMGTGGSPPSTPAVTVTTLVTPVETRSSGVKSKPSANQIRSVATITATAPRTINEWGLFDAATSGTLWSSRWFTAISLASGDAIEFTYTLTISSFTA